MFMESFIATTSASYLSLLFMAIAKYLINGCKVMHRCVVLCGLPTTKSISVHVRECNG